MKYYEEWLLKAKNDLLTAQVLWESKRGLTDTAVYHTQQSAEKALKAILAFNSKTIERTHNVRYLHDVVCKMYPELTSLSESIYFVSPLDTLFRYPGIDLFPSDETTIVAIESAELILNTVQELLVCLEKQ